MHDFANVYDDAFRAAAYSQLDFPGTYYLAYRDLPSLFAAHSPGSRALDFGCGTGRSTRFLRGLGYSVTGVDVSAPMVLRARELDPDGDYRLLPAGSLKDSVEGPYDLILSAFTFDNVGGYERKVSLLRDLRDVLGPDGCLVNLVSSPEIYVNEWASFTTRDYPENRRAVSGDPVRIVMLDVEDRRPVEDIVWSEADYHRVYDAAGWKITRIERPLATGEEPIAWVSEKEIAPWTIYVLGKDR